MPKDVPTPHSFGHIEALLKRELHLLELLFDDSGLTSLRRHAPLHPAVKRYDAITAFITNKLEVRFEDADVVLQVGSMLLDGLAIDPTGLPLDPPVTADTVFKLIEDPEVFLQLRTRVSDTQQFTDQMTSLACWAMLRRKGFAAKLVERMGLPDILVPLVGKPNEWIEVKRIRMGSKPGRAREVIKKANRQIKRADPNGVGALYLSIERPQQRVAFDDTSPPEVQAYIDEVDRELCSGHSRSVGFVIVAWDDHMVRASSPERTYYFLRRRSVLREHQAPRCSASLPRNALDLGETVMLPLLGPRAMLKVPMTWTRPTPNSTDLASIPTGGVTVTDLFRRVCEETGDVRSVHAVQALRQPSAVASYELAQVRILLVTRRVTSSKHPYTLLLIASVRNGDQTEILLGFHIYDDAVVLSEETLPFDVFAVLLERYGVPIEVGGLRALFIPRATVELPELLPGETSEDRMRMAAKAILPVALPQEEPFLYAHTKFRDKTMRTMDVAWAFAILIERYRCDIRRHRR